MPLESEVRADGGPNAGQAPAWCHDSDWPAWSDGPRVPRLNHCPRPQIRHIARKALFTQYGAPVPLVFRKQPSGGRGEYELVGSVGGISAMDLVDRGFRWDTPFGQKETEVALSHQGGKRRLRLTASGTPHIQRQAAALGLLPRSIREEAKVSHGRPIVLEKGYILDVEVSLVTDDGAMATVRPAVFTGRSGPANDSAHVVNMVAAERFQRLDAVWQRAEVLPEAVGLAVLAHRERLLSDSTIGVAAEQAVATVIDALVQYRAPGYIPGADPLPALEVLVGLVAEVDLPEPPEAPADLPEIRIRLESEYRLARARGAGHERFKRAVQKAYDYRCAFCGMRALDIPGLARAGVDAAHIFPWGQYDLDVVQNGLLLCKRDHWAFDAHVLLLRHHAGVYSVEVNPRYADRITDPETLEALNQATGTIPQERLPQKAAGRPGTMYIDKLYEDLEQG